MMRAPLQRGTTAMTRSPMARGASVLTRSPLARGSVPMKSHRPKTTKIRRSARAEDCTLLFLGCINDTETTVWCHSNRLADGKGLGLKADDEAGCYGCGHCHAYLDGGWAADPNMTYEQVQDRFEQARAKSRMTLQRKGLVAQ